MRDTKSLLLLLVSLLLVLVSFVLIWTWGYNFYSKKDTSKIYPGLAAVESSVFPGAYTDSLQKKYSADLLALDKQLDSTLLSSDSLKNELEIKLAEFYRLRSEIAVILKNRETKNDFSVARQKLNELKAKVNNLREKNNDVDKENKQLNEVLIQFSKPVPGNPQKEPESISASPVTPEKNRPIYPVFTASDIRLSAHSGKDGNETSEVAKTERINGYFTVSNFNSQLTNADLYVIVFKPDGKVLQGSGWESGSFTTSEGKKIYSYKFSFSYSRGETKPLSFSLKSGSAQRGTYTMEVYYNGLLIGKTVKNLS